MSKDKNIPSKVVVEIIEKYISKKKLCDIATKAELSSLYDLARLTAIILKKHNKNVTFENVEKLWQNKFKDIYEKEFYLAVSGVLEKIRELGNLTDDKQIMQSCDILLGINQVWHAVFNDVVELSNTRENVIKNYKQEQSVEMNDKRHAYKRMLILYAVELYKKAHEQNNNLTCHSFASKDENIEKILKKANEIKQQYNLPHNLVNEETIGRCVYDWLRKRCLEKRRNDLI